jgi:hypothetical protein
LVDIFYLGDLDAEDVEYKAVEYLVEYIDGTRQGPFRIRSDAEEHADATDGIVIEVPSSAEANKGEEEDE